MNEEDFVRDKIDSNQESMMSSLQREQTAQTQRSILEQQQNTGMVKEQLDLAPEIERIENLLRGKYQTTDEYGNIIWEDPKNKQDIMLTEEGIQFILNSISWYLNKNLLLSNYDEETILSKMEDYATSLSDLLFMRSEIYFTKPSTTYCEKLLVKRIDNMVEKRLSNMRIRGIEITDEDEKGIRKKVIESLQLEKEIEKISENEIKDRLKGFEHLIRVIQDAVHSTYNRSYMGGERRSIRQSMHISESRNPDLKPRHNISMNPFNLFRK
jgi:hypothetical protein|tara:strand:+ start:8928 stop:9734 length:807 start_codon:yes stop_codon:yes gene_type:complete